MRLCPSKHTHVPHFKMYYTSNATNFWTFYNIFIKCVFTGEFSSVFIVRIKFIYTNKNAVEDGWNGHITEKNLIAANTWTRLNKRRNCTCINITLQRHRDIEAWTLLRSFYETKGSAIETKHNVPDYSHIKCLTEYKWLKCIRMHVRTHACIYIMLTPLPYWNAAFNVLIYQRIHVFPMYEVQR